MLFKAAALLTVTVALSGLTAVIVAPQMSASASASGALATADTSRAFLDQMGQLPTRDIAGFVDGNPEAVMNLLSAPPPATAVAAWWAVISDSARQSLSDGAPQLIGNLDGLPMKLRDTLNRAHLRQTIIDVENKLSAGGRVEQAEATQQLRMLKEIEKSLITPAAQPERNLLSIDTVWPGRAAIVIGNLDTADYVSYLVPGMFFAVDRQMVDWTIISQDLYDEQVGWVRTLAETDASLRDATVATVAWIGYQTPGILEIASLDLAEEGAKFISSAVHGVHATRTGNKPYVTLVAHSYGSTASLMAIVDGTVSVDALVLIGSPGGAAQTVDDLGMPDDKVFVGEAAWDPVVDTAFFGSDPGDDAFGAQKMSVDGGDDPLTGKALDAAVGHLGYFEAGTEAMRNMALVGLDRGDLVTDGSEVGPE